MMKVLASKSHYDLWIEIKYFKIFFYLVSGPKTRLKMPLILDNFPGTRTNDRYPPQLLIFDR